MKIHAIKTGTVAVRPTQTIGQGSGILKMINIFRSNQWTEPLPILAWAIEHPDGIILVDTGETSKAAEPGYFPSWHPYFRNLREWVKPEEEIGLQLKNIGINPSDVRSVIMTHLHTDHAGGLAHFPNTKILVHKRAYKEAQGLKGLLGGFLNNRFPSWFKPELFELENNPLGPFPQSLRINNDIFIVSTFGHTKSHVSVIVKSENINYFIAGDSSYTQENMLQGKVDGVSHNDKVALETLKNIKAFCESNPTIYLPSHDPDSAKRLLQQEIVSEKNLSMVS